MTDVLDDTRREIEQRLKKLRPAFDEYQRLEAAAAALDGVQKPRPATAPARRRSGPAASRQQAAGERRRPGRPRGSGSRGVQALALVKRHPGITIPQLADEMGIKQNYLYRVLPDLAEQGLVAKEGRGWHPKVAA